MLNRQSGEGKIPFEFVSLGATSDDLNFRIEIFYFSEKSFENPLEIKLLYSSDDWNNVTETYNLTNDGLISYVLEQKSNVLRDKFVPNLTHKVGGLLKYAVEISSLFDGLKIPDNISKFKIIDELIKNTFKENHQKYMVNYSEE